MADFEQDAMTAVADPAQAGQARLFYFAYDEPNISGGERHTYSHVDLLNANGFEAYVLHTRPGYRHRWFKNQTRVIDFSGFWKIYDQARDVIVVPEPMAHDMMRMPGRKVIFNKNLFNAFRGFGRERSTAYPYLHESVIGVLCVSDHNLEHLRFAFPHARLFRVSETVDPTLYPFAPLSQKRKRIACVMKQGLALMVLYHSLMARAQFGLNRMEEYEWVPLEGLSQEQVADVLRETLVLVTLNTFEGLPRTVLEAASCGCVVLGYGAGPLKECLAPACQCEPDDLIGFGRRLEDITNRFPDNAAELSALVEGGRRIAAEFTRERQRQQVLAAWRDILTQ
jgi:glycosyltransferase involved in cell wall biosynthesis